MGRQGQNLQAKDVAFSHPFWIESPGHFAGASCFRWLKLADPRRGRRSNEEEGRDGCRDLPGYRHDCLDRKLPAKEEIGVPDVHKSSELEPQWG
jgi:hypothetical protein